MASALTFAALLATSSSFVAAAPSKSSLKPRWEYESYFDLQGHRGGRGHTIENTLPSFADGLINGLTTLELDTGLTADGHLVVWHDENFVATKCKDSQPVFDNDPMYPYVGKYIANLTLAQIKTLDCGSLRLDDFPLQITVPGTKVSTLEELFEFVKCATSEPVLYNIESKVDGDFRNLTRAPEDFVAAYETLYKKWNLIDRITHQSFDWRSLIISKKVIPDLRTSALCDDTTIYAHLASGAAGNITTHGKGPSNWLAGIDIDSFNGSTPNARVAQAAASIGADFISPVGTAYGSPVVDVSMAGYIPFVTADMVNTAHGLGVGVKPWTVNRLNVIKYLIDLGIDGLITDFPRDVRIWGEQQGLKLAPQSDPKRVAQCLKKHNQLSSSGMETRPTLENTRAFLQQITRSNLRDLVFAVRRDQALPAGSGIKQLDRVILEEQERIKTYNLTTGDTQEPSEQSKDAVLPGERDENDRGLRNGDMIEIQGPSGCGKTELVYKLTISRILPFSHPFFRSPSSPPGGTTEPVHIKFGGPSLSAVIYSLTSAPFSLTRLSSLLRSHIQSTLLHSFSSSDLNSALRDQTDDLIKMCLLRVRLCTISESQGTWGLAFALKSFETLVEDELEGAEEVGLVAIDGFGESFWADRAVWDAEVKERQSKKRKAISSLDEGDHDADQDDEDSVVKEKETEREKDNSTTEKQKTRVEDEEDALKNQPMYQVLLQLTSIRQRYFPLIVLTTQLLSHSTNPSLKSIPSREHHLRRSEGSPTIYS
ncbi:plc-like phosphodiesterase [Phaffia rhodozyma]|uniref:Plc-like phosphodiesterase n=1 Tax=Phaffia rhodozyma TaxID=264483 RepID=A0A0F7SUV3_PHARH|nr:plc-like phosphodiesterase [Phaffia rhodozyma]